ncbi:MAG: A/G-specific adenine glycosylase [Ilumatobacteraceae bacterium]
MTEAPSISEEVVSELLAWGGPRLRDLPWRRTRDPWGVLVSEVMAQQTQVARIIPRWEAFMERFPTPESLAEAPLADLLRLWQGLGYPRRARALHEAARRIRDSGRFPSTVEQLMDLPGVGPYTARAVAAFAFDLDVGVLDTNVGRLLARLAGERLRPAAAQSMADDLVPKGDAWIWNQVVMDFGATVCTARSPRCDHCPVSGRCAWAGSTERADPAQGSAGVSGKQARFEGSDRQARGRLLAALVDGPILAVAVAVVMDRDSAVADRLLADLVAEGLCRRVDDEIVLG